MNIRAARECDLEAWAKLRTELWPDARDEHVSELKAYFANESVDIVQAYVLENRLGAVVGFIELNIRSFAEGSRNPEVPYVEGWLVDASYQGRGHGKALMNRAEQWAMELGFKELASDAEIDNEKSISVHKALGFAETERVVCFLKRLS